MTHRKITLGKQEHEVAEIDLGNLKLLGVGQLNSKPKPDEPEAEAEVRWYDNAYIIIACGLGWFNEKKEPDVEKVKALKGVTIQQVAEAKKQILLETGLLIETAEEAPQPKGKTEGESERTG